MIILRVILFGNLWKYCSSLDLILLVRQRRAYWRTLQTMFGGVGGEQQNFNNGSGTRFVTWIICYYRVMILTFWKHLVCCALLWSTRVIALLWSTRVILVYFNVLVQSFLEFKLAASPLISRIVKKWIFEPTSLVSSSSNSSFILNSQDESSLIWISSSGERSLKFASVSRIIPGQRTVRFVFFNPYFSYV